MARHPITDPDAAGPVGSADLRILPEAPGPESDFADLAARFSAASGGGLSAELSADLALQIVLNEIVEQACLATGATGAALALQHDGELVCSATSGSTTPELGSRLSMTEGLSGECIRTRRAQLCSDVVADGRPEVQVLQRLGARSAAAMPLLHGTEVAGVFEVLSSRPAAFGERDERTLEALSRRAVINLQRAAQPVPPPATVSPAAPQPPAPQLVERPRDRNKGVVAEVSRPKPPQPRPLRPAVVPVGGSQIVRRGFDVATWVMGVAVVFCAVLLGVSIGRHLGTRRLAQRPHRPAAVSTQSVSAADADATKPVSSTPSLADKPPSNSPPTNSAPGAGRARSTPDAAIPPGSLLIYENGKEVFRMSPNQNSGGTAAADRAVGVRPAASLEPEKVDVVQLPPAEAESSLIHRVEPEYPDDALQHRIQGQVLMDLRIGADGSVEGLRVASGPPQLSQAATDAVKQWKFQPHTVKGKPVAVQTTVTLNFRLPQ